MNNVLPPQNGVRPHITGQYGENRGGKGPHGGVDFNYKVPGQKGINMQHPHVHAPVDGKVIFSGGQYGTVKIRTQDGKSHELLHMDKTSVHVGDRVKSGDVVGTMGGTGPKGPNQYAQYVHYQVKSPTGQRLNPQTLGTQG